MFKLEVLGCGLYLYSVFEVHISPLNSGPFDIKSMEIGSGVEQYLMFFNGALGRGWTTFKMKWMFLAHFQSNAV